MNEKRGIKKSLRQVRIFSEAIKKGVVRDIEKGRCSVKEASREIMVHQQTIYNWLYKYSTYLQKNKVLVVEDKSEAYRTKELEKRLVELEAALGRKQMEIDLLNKILETASKEAGKDLKKSISSRLWNGFGFRKGSNTDTR